MATASGTISNVIAALASFFIPGLGQLLQGRVLWAIIFFVATVTCYALVVTWPLGVIFHIWAIVSAAIYRG